MSRYQPALLGGLFIGVLSSLPIIKAGNLCCCLWVVSGGVLVTYLLQQRTPEPVGTSDTLLQGVLAGVVGTAISVTFAALTLSLTSDLLQGPMQQAMDRPDFPPEARAFLTRLMTGHALIPLIALLTLPCYVVFSMLGSLLGLAFFRKKVTPPPGPPQ